MTDDPIAQVWIMALAVPAIFVFAGLVIEIAYRRSNPPTQVKPPEGWDAIPDDDEAA
jgi:hypothetical protein